MFKLEKAAADYAKKNAARFHMPGHKGRKPEGVLPSGLYGLDITELAFSDELFEPCGAIAEAEAEAARIFGSGGTLISPFGATSCINTMTELAAERGKLLIPRNMHYSVFNAVGNCSAEAVIIPVSESEKTPAGVLSPKAVKTAFESDPDIAALFVTSVDYYGCVSDIAAYVDICRSYGKLLLVDNSHGAHLRFIKNGGHPLSLGADMVCDSIHKTLPAMTGSALLHFADGAFLREGRKLMKRRCSSSPSYPIMLSICAALRWADENGERKYNALAERCGRLKKDIAAYGYSVGGEPCRLYVTGGETGLSGAEISEILAKFACVPEFTDEHGALLMLTPMNTEEELSSLSTALLSAEKKKSVLPKRPRYDTMLRRAMDISRAARLPSECVPKEESEGRIAAECLGVFPPGLPQVITGEYIGRLPDGINTESVLVVKER